MFANESSHDIAETVGSGFKGSPNPGKFVNKELDLSFFLQNFYFSPAISLHQAGSSLLERMGFVPPFNIEEPLIPLDKLVHMVSPQNGLGTDDNAHPIKEPLSRFISASPPAFNSVTHPNM